MKRGYTLVELLGVITILVILIIVMFASYTQFKKNTSNSLDEAIRTMIAKESENYVKKYQSNIKDGNIYCITLKDLLDNNLMSDPVTNADGEKISENTKIKISINNSEYDVEVDVMKCDEKIVSD